MRRVADYFKSKTSGGPNLHLTAPRQRSEYSTKAARAEPRGPAIPVHLVDIRAGLARVSRSVT